VDLTEPPELPDFLRRCGVRNEALARLAELVPFLDHLREANARLNLTRLTSATEFWLKHVADSLAVGSAMPELLHEPMRVADVGCGAGFPAIPLAWANPALRLTAIEARPRKAEFVRAAARRLDLVNLEVLARQAREIGRRPEYAAAYDAVLLRAVGPPAGLVRECRCLLGTDAAARLVFYLTPAAVAESRAQVAREAHKFGLDVAESAPVELPQGVGTRQFLLLSRAAR
jgi:16S rRNA (guanine527-N7)-methyltransferase